MRVVVDLLRGGVVHVRVLVRLAVVGVAVGVLGVAVVVLDVRVGVRGVGVAVLVGVDIAHGVDARASDGVAERFPH
ncbi:MAG: hypothetical protein JWP64_4314 [Pseudonocardia sp.]|nr:hypothetical protein [Pseudonocardia sp.]MDT7698514.1 hypothetical protein [Pseudonocardiales bacterium]